MTSHDEGSIREDQYLVWGIAARLVTGLLANPSKSHFSVKDTISLFDEVLTELTAYAKVRGELAAYARQAEHEMYQHVDRSPSYAPAGRLVRRQVPVPVPSSPSQPSPTQPQPEPQQEQQYPTQG